MRFFKVIFTIQILIFTTMLFGQSNIQYSGFSISGTHWVNNYVQKPFSAKYSEWQQFGGLFASDLSSYQEITADQAIESSYLTIDVAGYLNFRNNNFGLSSRFQTLSIGLQFLNNASNRYTLSYRNNYAVDTFSSGQDLIIVDSITDYTLNLYEQRDRVYAFVQYELTTNPSHRFSIYTGPRISAAYHYNRGVVADEDNNTLIHLYRNNRNNPIEKLSLYQSDGYQTYDQVEDLPNSWEVSLILPVGMRFRLSKSDNILGLIYLFVEGQIGAGYLINSNEANEFAPVENISAGLRFWDFPFN